MSIEGAPLPLFEFGRETEAAEQNRAATQADSGTGRCSIPHSGPVRLEQQQKPGWATPRPPAPPVKRDYAAAAAAWRADHPDGWALIVEKAELAAAQGLRFGVKCIVEVVRWHMRYETQCETTRAGGYKLNNNYTATFARMLIAEYPAWAQFIETREAGDQ